MTDLKWQPKLPANVDHNYVLRCCRVAGRIKTRMDVVAERARDLLRNEPTNLTGISRLHGRSAQLLGRMRRVQDIQDAAVKSMDRSLRSRLAETVLRPGLFRRLARAVRS